MSQVQIHDDPASAGAAVAAEIAELIRARAAEGRTAALGLATGATPASVYQELRRLHREQGLSFAGVQSFNLDEYWPIDPAHPESFQRSMREQLIDAIDLPPAAFHIPDGLTPGAALPAACAAYERAILDAGGLDLQLLGVGLNGHIGFNEPGALAGSRTRLVELAESTRSRAAGAFGDDEVPRRGITMGIGTILQARRLRVLAFGAQKAGIVARALASAPTPALPASLLGGHPDLVWVLDRAAAARIHSGSV
ncbi:MAG: glucosamine-6-phosphate deaminase [Planctomycetes bacterium]|nr:glucosamine-6-phosphate deaminase [Planctomycetota bacterium]